MIGRFFTSAPPVTYDVFFHVEGSPAPLKVRDNVFATRLRGRVDRNMRRSQFKEWLKQRCAQWQMCISDDSIDFEAVQDVGSRRVRRCHVTLPQDATLGLLTQHADEVSTMKVRKYRPPERKRSKPRTPISTNIPRQVPGARTELF